MNKFYSRKKGDSPAKKHLEADDAAVGVALNLDHSHVSLIYPDYGDGERQLKQLHFMLDKIEAWNLSLEPDAKGHLFYAQAACVDEENLAGFNAYLMAVARNEAPLRYGVDWKDYLGLFDADGKFKPPENAYGLTCASFLSEVFHGYRMTLFDMSMWPANQPEDVKWRDDLCERRLDMLERGQGRLTVEHIRQILETTPLVRLRPTHVAAAVASPAPTDSPAWDHASATALAEELARNFAEDVA